MTEHTRARPASTRRGAVSRFNDNTMEYLIAGARIAALVTAVATLAALVGLIWTADGRWALTAVVTLAVGATAGWFGFKTKGNEEWYRHESTD